MEDPQKIQAMINHLKISSPAGADTWMAVEGYNALTAVNIKSDNSVFFNPASGVIVKIFANTTTGEIKIFPHTMFEK